MSVNKNIIDSFSIRDELNPKIWDTSDKEIKMRPKVRESLLKIANDFIDNLDDKVFVDDIMLTGSLSNYNWSKYSDFDLHLLIDFEQYDNQSDLYKELFDLKKQVFNDKHNITIFGYDVELYAQDLDESHYSSGVYSVLNDEWISKPKKVKFNLDKNVLKNKVKCWTDKIDSTIENSEKTENFTKLKTLKDKLKKYRKSGLEKNGELSYENLVFKYLRRSGHVKNLMDSINNIKDKVLSIESQKIDEALTDYNFVEKKPGIVSGLDQRFAKLVEPFIEELDSIGCGGRFTSGRRKPGKNKRSYHITGQALDMTFNNNDCYCKAMDICVKYPQLFCLDERSKITKDWTGAHLHVSVAQRRGKTKPCGSKYSSTPTDYIDEEKIVDELEKLKRTNKTFSFNKNSSKYNRGVKIIQIALQNLGFLFTKNGVDGIYGKETENKVMDFQETYNLANTGNITKEDLSKIIDVTKNS